MTVPSTVVENVSFLDLRNRSSAQMETPIKTRMAATNNRRTQSIPPLLGMNTPR
jgi:hypothetical protein